MANTLYDPARVTNFSPSFGAGGTISATTTSAAGSVTMSADLTEVVIYNSGLVPVFLRWGTGAQTAVVTDYPLAPGATQVFRKGPATNIAAITASSTATVYYMPGFGS